MMFKEVNKEEAIMAALRRVPAFRLNVDADSATSEQLVFQDILEEFFEDLVDDTDSRFIIDDPEGKTIRPVINVPVYSSEEIAKAFDNAELSKSIRFDRDCVPIEPETDQSEEKADQNDPEADQSEEKADQSEEKADQSEEKADQDEPEAEPVSISEFTPMEVHHKRGRQKVDVTRVRQLHNEGYGITAIAEEMGVSVTTIKKYL